MNRFGFGMHSPEKKRILFIIGGIIIFIAIVVAVILFLSKVTATPDIKMVSGTEYISNEPGQIIVRLQDSRNISITDANCVVSLLYPDKSFVFVDAPMIPTSVPGNYYHPFMTPNYEGVYEEHIVCNVIRNNNLQELHISSSFHVSTGLNLIVEVSKSQREQYESLIALLNSIDTNLNNRINGLQSDVNEVNYSVSNLQSYVDNNIMTEINNVNYKVQDLNSNLSTNIYNIQENLSNTINQSMTDSSQGILDKFRQSAEAMANIFGDQNS